MDTDSEDSPWKYFPFELGESEDLEEYEPGGFHPVHLGDIYDGTYRIVHKLGYGGFSTVWLAREIPTKRWVALKVVAAKESPLYNDQSIISGHSGITGSHLFVVADRQFWIDGPNGRHLCLVSSVLGPDLSRLSKGLGSRVKPAFARKISLHATQALGQLHSNSLCHGDFTASNMALRLITDFNSLEEDEFLRLFGPPQTAPLRTYSEKPPAPHGPDYIVVPLDFCSSNVNLLSDEICVFDFDQSFIATSPPTKHPGIPAKYLSPEVAVGQPPSAASDVWALGCAIFRIRSGYDIFFDYDTDSPADALKEIVKAVGEVPENWGQVRFDDEGFVAHGDEGEPFCSSGKTQPLEDRVRGIVDEPPGLFIDSLGQPVGPLAEEELQPAMFEDEAVLREPYPAAFNSMVWKPTSVCIDGNYLTGYPEGEDDIFKAFPRISETEALLLVDLLSKIFTYDPANRIAAQQLLAHPWFTLL